MILSKLAARLAKVSENLHEESVVGFDPTLLLTFISALFSCLSKQDDKPVPPGPPEDVDTPEKQKAWANAFAAKQLVDSNYDDGEFSPSLVTRAARQVKRDGGPTKKAERKSVAIQLLKETRDMSHREVYEAALEAK